MTLFQRGCVIRRVDGCFLAGLKYGYPFFRLLFFLWSLFPEVSFDGIVRHLLASTLGVVQFSAGLESKERLSSESVDGSRSVSAYPSPAPSCSSHFLAQRSDMIIFLDLSNYQWKSSFSTWCLQFGWSFPKKSTSEWKLILILNFQMIFWLSSLQSGMVIRMSAIKSFFTVKTKNFLSFWIYGFPLYNKKLQY